MKKHITRTLTMLLAVAILMGLFTVNASAAGAFAYTGTALCNEIKSLPQNLYVPWDDLYVGPNQYGDTYGSDRAAGTAWERTSPPVTKYLNQLSKYMPHVTEAQRSTVSRFPYGLNSLSMVYLRGITDMSLLPEMEAKSDALASAKASLDADYAAREVYTKQGVLTEQFSAAIVSVRKGNTDVRLYNFNDRVVKLFSDGRFVNMEGGGNELDSTDGGSFGGESPIDIFLADSLRGDTLLRNVYLSKNVSYYGENTFRGSALETVVFPYYWYSDHNAYTDDYVLPNVFKDSNGRLKYTMETANQTDGDMPLGVRNDLLFGKNANIIEANAFADCTNLKSVIMPTEPAHLYIADGVFANCPKLTVYGPAGGKLESYCKANGIKFQAIPEASIEEPLDSSIAPKMFITYHARNCGHGNYEYGYSYVTVANRAVTDDAASNYPNAIGITRQNVAGRNEMTALLGTDGTAKSTATLNAATAALNRYRGADANAREISDNHGYWYMF